MLLGDLPNVYVYAANNPSESIIAKRRGYGTIVSHNVPPYGRWGPPLRNRHPAVALWQVGFSHCVFLNRSRPMDGWLSLACCTSRSTCNVNLSTCQGCKLCLHACSNEIMSQSPSHTFLPAVRQSCVCFEAGLSRGAVSVHQGGPVQAAGGAEGTGCRVPGGPCQECYP